MLTIKKKSKIPAALYHFLYLLHKLFSYYNSYCNSYTQLIYAVLALLAEIDEFQSDFLDYAHYSVTGNAIRLYICSRTNVNLNVMQCMVRYTAATCTTCMVLEVNMVVLGMPYHQHTIVRLAYMTTKLFCQSIKAKIDEYCLMREALMWVLWKTHPHQHYI